MKHKKIIKWKVFVLVIGLITLWNCQQDDFSEKNMSLHEFEKFEIKEVSFSSLKVNSQALQKIKEINSFKNSSSAKKYRTIYNEQYDVFIDTTRVLMIKESGKHTITFKIVSEENNEDKIENLILKSTDNGDYSAYITEYILSEQELLELSRGNNLINKIPASIIELENNYQTMSILVSGNGADCVEISIREGLGCRDRNGNTITFTGNVDGRCVGLPFPVSYTILSVNAGCLSGGGGSTGGGSTGGGSTGGGSTGGGSTGGGGNTPIVTTPVLTIPASRSLYFNLSDEQKEWWDSVDNFFERNQIKDYLDNQNGSKEFAKEVINAGISNTLISAKPFFKYPENSNYTTLYPNFTEILQDNIPFLASQYPQISQIISGITGVSVQQVMQDLQWGYGAEIVIEQLGVNSYGDEIKGLFNPSNPKTIKIDIDLVNLYENANESDIAPLQLLITFSTLLHELVHYEDYQFDNIMQNDIELGLYFEYLYMGGYYELDDNNNVIFIIEN